MEIGSLVEYVCDRDNSIYTSVLGSLLKTPIKGKLYTVRGFHRKNGGILLEEINNSCCIRFCESGLEPAFNKNRFTAMLPPIDISAVIEQECELVLSN